MEPERGATTAGFHLWRVWRVVRIASRLLGRHLRVAGELAQVEWAIEKKRLRRMLLLTVVAVSCGFLGTVYLIALSLAAIWESAYRSAYLCGFVLLFWVAAFAVWQQLLGLSRARADRFAHVRRELDKTAEVIRKHL